jgi:hypothetical protein
MSHFAYVPNIFDGKGIVEQVIRIDQDTLNTGAWGNPSDWIQTSYNTYGNQHLLGGTPLRGNYAGVGHTYDVVNDVFYAPSPFPSWVLNSSWTWEAPVSMPTDGKKYGWDESVVAWVEVDESELNNRIQNESQT